MELFEEWREGVSMHWGQSMAIYSSVGCLFGILLKASNHSFRSETSSSPSWNREVKSLWKRSLWGHFHSSGWRRVLFFSSNTWSPSVHPVQEQNRMATVSSSNYPKQRALHPLQIYSNSAFKWNRRFVNPDSPGLTFGRTKQDVHSRYFNHLPLAFTRIWHKVPLGM